jgi:hypothetical protein
MGRHRGQTETGKGKRQYGSHSALHFLLFCCCVLFLQVSCQEQAKVSKANTLQKAAKEARPSEPKADLTVSKSAARAEKADSTPSKAAIGLEQAESRRPKPAARGQRPESAPKVSVAARPQPDRAGPTIRFEKIVHDFGEIGPGTKHTCEFRFTNTGPGLLKILKIDAPCGCTVPQLTKKEYKPGETGVLKVTYSASTQPASPRKYVYVHTNDADNPKVTLTIKARIVAKVSHDPTRLNLLLKDENAASPKITLTSLDKKPFSITGFTSTANCITADYDSSVEATKFVLQPKVDLEKLRTGPNGLINISLTHPECEKVTIAFNALARFTITPPQIIVLNAEPQKPIVRRVLVLNNYREEFEIESASSRSNFLKVLSQKKVSNGYQFEVEITPPASDGKRTTFTDVFSVKIKDGETLTINCRGFYSKKR